MELIQVDPAQGVIQSTFDLGSRIHSAGHKPRRDLLHVNGIRERKIQPAFTICQGKRLHPSAPF
jgi:hypothetical protein